MNHSLSACADRMRFDEVFASHDRRRALAVFIIGLLLTVAGGTRLVASVHDAAAEQLNSAQSSVTQAISPALGGSQRAAVRRTAVVLVSRPASRLSYVSVRDERGHLLASVGSHNGVFAWLARAGSRSWHAWLYRTLSIRALLPVTNDAGDKASVAFGLSWPAVLASSWRVWWLWLALCGLGLTCLLAGVVGWFVSGAVSRDGERRRSVTTTARSTATARSSARSWRARMARATAGLTPSGNRGASDSRPTANAGFEQLDAEGGVAVDRASGGPRQPPPIHAERANVARESPGDPASTEPASPRQSGEHGHDEVPSAPVEAMPPVGRASPQMWDDTTLDLRFQPIWRGTERGLLAGGWLTLIWRSGDGRPVAPATLAGQAARAQSLGAFTEWLAERVATLQSNWRALALPTVPVVVPLAAAWRGDTEVWDIWRDALTRVGSTANDLVLQVDASSADALPALPVRCMPRLHDVDTAIDSASDMLLVSARDAACGDVARQVLTASQQSLLLGPLTQPETQAELLAQPTRVAWFSAAAGDDNLYTPRGFARLVSRCARAPL